MSKNLAFVYFGLLLRHNGNDMKILVITETDSCCGPMAAAFLNDYSTSIEVISVGRNPSQSIEPLVVAAMKECLVDLEGYVPKSIKGINLTDFDMVYECPDLPCPTMMVACRELRDFIKNEAYLFFRKLLGRHAGLPLPLNNSQQLSTTLNSQL